jgi:hypothetical protein
VTTQGHTRDSRALLLSVVASDVEGEPTLDRRAQRPRFDDRSAPRPLEVRRRRTTAVGRVRQHLPARIAAVQLAAAPLAAARVAAGRVATCGSTRRSELHQPGAQGGLERTNTDSATPGKLSAERQTDHHGDGTVTGEAVRDAYEDRGLHHRYALCRARTSSAALGGTPFSCNTRPSATSTRRSSSPGLGSSTVSISDQRTS